MDLMENDAQLATVVGHEVAHVRANHGGERMSQQLGASVTYQAAAAALGSGGQSAQLALGPLGSAPNMAFFCPSRASTNSKPTASASFT